MRIEFPSLIYERSGKLATITLNRPERLNAFDYASKWDLKAALTHAAADDGVRVVAFRGAGRAFSSGIDLKDLSSGKIDERNFSLWEECLRLIETMDKLAIALIHGYALGSGVQLALACDLRIATPSTRFGLPAGREGLLPGLSVWRLAKFIGAGRARELSLLGHSIEGEEALRIGLISGLVPDDDCENGFAEWTARLVSLASDGVRATRRAMNEVADMDFDQAFDTYMNYQRQGLASADFAEAMAAYREKRTPVWR
jgi:enoyl-CoA hydratase/carnithine racemase